MSNHKGQGCPTCFWWKGRTDLNKCRIKPDILPDWSAGCKDYKAQIKVPDEEAILARQANADDVAEQIEDLQIGGKDV